MIQELRKRFNQNFSPEKYARILEEIEQLAGGKIPFRVSESPIFLPGNLMREMEETAQQIVRMISANPKYGAASERIPSEYLFPNLDEHPLFLLFDYALTRNSEGFVCPKIVEIQGFPSLIAFQYFLSHAYLKHYELPQNLHFLCDGLSEQRFMEIFREAILNGHAAENVALVDVRPWEQGTWPDFTLTQRLLPGLAVLCPSTIIKRGRKLFYEKQGKEIPIKRIFHRMILDELKQLPMTFSFREELDVEWAGHPNWFFFYSKLSLPFLKHRNVPNTFFLDEFEELPDDLHRYVLKPLFSLSGKGLVLDPDRDIINAINPAQRRHYVLQEKVEYADVIQGPEGGIRCEVRMMYIWLDKPQAIMTLSRMSRGRLMGCSYNNTDPWTGHAVSFF
jgi:hypothetical protein